MKKCIVNGKVILHDEIVEKNIFIENDKIVEISQRQPCDEEVIDAHGLYVAPGFIDVHMVVLEVIQCIQLLRI